MSCRVRLPFRRDVQWRWRWLQQPYPSRAVTIHRVLRHKGANDDLAKIRGVETVCGKLWEVGGMPGVLSRMGAPRCRKCCAAQGIEQGTGAPYNAQPKIEEPATIIAPRRLRARAAR